MEKWKAEGGLEQLKAAKKEAKKEARLAKSGGKASPKKKTGTNCIKIGLPGKLILSKRKGLREVLFS